MFLNYWKFKLANCIFYSIYTEANDRGVAFFRFKMLSTQVLKSSSKLYCYNLIDNFNIRKFTKQYWAPIIWFNSHGSSFLRIVDYVYPVKSTLEVKGIFLNLFNLPQIFNPMLGLSSGVDISLKIILKRFFLLLVLWIDGFYY